LRWTWRTISSPWGNSGGAEGEMNLLSFAYLNIRRNRHRTLVTVGAMAFAGFIMIFYASLLEGWLLGMERNAVGMELGEIQIHQPGYRHDPDLYNLINDPGKVVEQAGRLGFQAAPRLFGGGLAAAGSASAGVRLRGVDIPREKLVTEMHDHLLAGNWLEVDDPHGIVLGRKLARTIDVQLGEEVVLVSQAADGSLANDLFRVRGILKSIGEGLDRSAVLMTEAAFRSFMALPEGVHEISLKRQEVERELEISTGELAAAFPELEVLSWKRLQPVLARIMEMSRYSLIILLLITYAAVGILTLNAMLMSVFERIPEFGVMKALGLSAWRLFLLVTAETLILVSFAVFLAMAAGIPLSLYYETHPLDFSGLARSSSTIAGIAFEPKWYCRVTPETVLLPVVFMYLIAALAILYPAIKAALIRPVDAIHHT